MNTVELDPIILSTPFKVQTNWHVITGSACSGKTTLIDLLAEKGFHTVPESARQYFEGEMAKGRAMDEIIEDKSVLEPCLLDFQLSIEEGIRAVEVAFLDRAGPDCIPFYRLYGMNPNKALAKCYQHRYASVFILDRLPYHENGVRTKAHGDPRLLDEWLARDYRAMGYDVVRVPVLSPEERLAFVFDRLSERGLI